MSIGEPSIAMTLDTLYPPGIGATDIKQIMDTKAVQTMYREDETQTIPWNPQFKVREGYPEVLYLDSFVYEKNLPAGRREVAYIEFMRKKRAWYKYIKEMYTPENKEIMKRRIIDIEKCEQSFTEGIFDSDIERRLELAEEQINEYHKAKDGRYQERLETVTKVYEAHKNDLKKKLFFRKQRELRKIHLREIGVNLKYHKMTPFEEYCDPLSDFNVNIARFGKNPKYADEEFPPDCVFDDIANLNVVTPSFVVKKVKQRKPIKKHNCEPTIDPLERSVGLISLGHKKGQGKPTSMLIPEEPVDNAVLERDPKYTHSVERDKISAKHEKVLQAILLIQTLIRGRVVQSLMSDGLLKYSDLIDEIKSTHGFYEKEKEEVNLERFVSLQDFRRYHCHLKLLGLVSMVGNSLSGNTIAEMVDFSAKEFERIQDERRARQLVYLAEKSRWYREAAESGRRQKELMKRKLLNEIYNHVQRRNEITSDVYLKLIKTEAIRKVAEAEADYITQQKADEIEQMRPHDPLSEDPDDTLTSLKRTEMVASLVHSYYMPFLEREMTRFDIQNYTNQCRQAAVNIIKGLAPLADPYLARKLLCKKRRRRRGAPSTSTDAGESSDSSMSGEKTETSVTSSEHGPPNSRASVHSVINEEMKDLKEAVAETLMAEAINDLIRERYTKHKKRKKPIVEETVLQEEGGSAASSKSDDSYVERDESAICEGESIYGEHETMFPVDIYFGEGVSHPYLHKPQKDPLHQPITPVNSIYSDYDSSYKSARLGLIKQDASEVADRVTSDLLYDMGVDIFKISDAQSHALEILREINEKCAPVEEFGEDLSEGEDPYHFLQLLENQGVAEDEESESEDEDERDHETFASDVTSFQHKLHADVHGEGYEERVVPRNASSRESQELSIDEAETELEETDEKSREEGETEVEEKSLGETEDEEKSREEGDSEAEGKSQTEGTSELEESEPNTQQNDLK